MRIGIIDLGTNSVRFDVHQITAASKARLLHREKIMVRLGQGVFIHGRLDPSAVHRTTHAFSIFRKIATQLHVSRVIALGTSALREAADSSRLVKSIRASTGFEIHVISGTEEARLIALGILTNEKNAKKKVGLIDIGGGSTEISICNDRKVLYCESFQLGTARLQQVFLKKSPPSPKSVDELRKYIRKIVTAKISEQGWPKVQNLIGSSGTIKALTRVIRKTTGKKVIELEDLSDLIQSMCKMTTTQLMGIEGIESKRVDMIVAGAILLEECMKALHAESVVQSDYSLRDGILQEQVELASQHMTSQMAFHIPDLYEKAKRLGGDEKHLKKSVALSEVLFDKLQSVHKLKKDWRIYLTAATILRNTGESVSLIGQQDHSYYIVKNADFPFVEPWESELVAQLCRHHERNRLDLKKSSLNSDKIKKRSFMKLWALLAIVDALDAIPAPIKISSVSVGRKGVKLKFSGGTSTEVEIYRVEQRKALFKEVFHKALIVERK